MSNASQHIVRLGFGFAVSQALRVIIELGIPDLLAASKQSVDELATAWRRAAVRQAGSRRLRPYDQQRGLSCL
jgi:hypothetical protein